MNLPYLTSDVPGIGGSIKSRPEDFFVQEIPLYEPSGTGEHVYVEIQKVGITTFQAVDRIARTLNVHPRDIGYAGLKDLDAVARQVLSIPGVSEKQVMDLKIPDLQPLWAARHGNKLRAGHLKANRFAIKLRDVNPTDVVKLPPVVDRLMHTGLPNFFGPQRFGRRGNNDLLGAAVVRNDNISILKLLLGDPQPDVDDAPTLEARRAFENRENEKALELFPRFLSLERRVLSRLIKSQKANSATKAVDERIRRLWISALQSRIFNELVSRRIDRLDKLLRGDVAYIHAKGAAFVVSDPAVEQPRADAFEISPTGMLIGYRVPLAEREAAEIEEDVLRQFALKTDDFRQPGRLRVKGERRPLRVQPEDVKLASGVDEHGAHITLAFTLPAGAFATSFVREITKNDAGLVPPRPARSGAVPDAGIEASDPASAELQLESDGLDPATAQEDVP